MENSSEVGPEVLDKKMAEPTNGTSNGSKVCQYSKWALNLNGVKFGLYSKLHCTLYVL